MYDHFAPKPLTKIIRYEIPTKKLIKLKSRGNPEQ